jgi:hypothetical protein
LNNPVNKFTLQAELPVISGILHRKNKKGP